MARSALLTTSAIALCAAFTAQPALAQTTQFERDTRVASEVLSSLLSFQRTSERQLAQEKLRRNSSISPVAYGPPFTVLEEHLFNRQGIRPDRSQILNSATRRTRIDFDFRTLVCMEEGDRGLHPDLAMALPYPSTRYTVISFFADETTGVSTDELYDFGRSGQAKIRKQTAKDKLIKIDWNRDQYHDAATNTWLALSDCMRRSSGFFAGTDVGFMVTGRVVRDFNNLRFDETYVEEAPIACPPAEHPTLTVGRQIRRYKTYKLNNPNPSDPLVDHLGNSIEATLGELNSRASTYYQGCRRLQYTRNGTFREKCARTIKGRLYPDRGRRIWDVHLLEVQPARGYYLDGEHRVLKPVDGTWSLRRQLCDDDAPASGPPFTTAKVSSYEPGVVSCSAKYGAAFPTGSLSQRRPKQITTVTFTNAVPATSKDIVSYGAWETVSNPCSKTTTSGVLRRERFVTGSTCMKEKQTYKTVITSYASGRASTSVETDQSPWSIFWNTCPVAGSGSSSSKPYYDVDGDGKPDFSTREDAVAYTRKKGGYVHEVDSTFGCETVGCSGPKVEGPGVGDFKGGTTGGSSGFGSTVLGGFFKSIFGGSSSSSSGGGGSSSSGSSSSCFTAGTLILMADGTERAIETIKVGDQLAHGTSVYAAGVFAGEPIYDLGGVMVTGEHFVLTTQGWMMVQDVPHAQLCDEMPDLVYCLATDTNLIPTKSIVFADYCEFGGSAASEIIFEQMKEEHGHV